ncbi:MAG: sensor domain-containing diguanylate cyclase [Myxococcales bacterium]|nr:sensor domain-containing diguanylate cyclase [Myxococcales bacterium]
MNPQLLNQLPQILFRIGKAIGSDESLQETLVKISKLVTELCGAAACSIMLSNPEEKTLLGKAAFGLRRPDFTTVSFRYGEGLAGWVAEHGESLLVSDVDEDARFLSIGDSSHIRSLACVPLMHRDAVVGVLTVTTPEVDFFTNSSIDLLALVANTVALDIENIRLRRVAGTDALTGAFNRQYLDNHFPGMVQDAHERGVSLSVAMFDLDRFKQVNDNYGHDVGDEILTFVAKRLDDASRAHDVLVRFGGEEFILLLPGANLATAAEIADRMRVRLANNAVKLERPDDTPLALDIRISAGVAELASGESPEQLFRRADQALYAAKANGRNRVEVAPAT